MLHIMEDEKELFTTLFSMMSPERRKRMETCVNHSKKRKLITLAGYRLRPNCFSKTSNLFCPILQEIYGCTGFRQEFIKTLTAGLEEEFFLYQEQLKGSAPFEELLEAIDFEAIRTTPYRAVPAFMAALFDTGRVSPLCCQLIYEKLTGEKLHREVERPANEPSCSEPADSMDRHQSPNEAPLNQAGTDCLSKEDHADKEQLLTTALNTPSTEPSAEKKDAITVHITQNSTTKKTITTPSDPTDRQERAEPHAPIKPIVHGPVKRFFDIATPTSTAFPPLGADLHRYLVYTRRTGSFTNLHIAAEWVFGEWKSNIEEYKILFPNYGAVNLYSTARLSYPDGAFFVVDLNPHGLDPNFDNLTGERRNDYCGRIAYNLLKKEDRFFDAADFGLYPIVYVDERLGGKPDFERNVYVRYADNNTQDEHNFHLKNVQALVAYGNYLYGPATIKEDGQERPYVNFRYGTNRGVLSGFRRKESAVHVVSQYCPDGTTDNYYHSLNVADTTRLTPVLCDVMTDDSLMSKLVSAATSDRSSRDKMSQWLETNGAATELFTSDERVRQSRFARVADILNAADIDSRFIDDIAALVSDTLDREGAQGALYTKVVKRISENPELMKRLDSHRVIAAKLRELNDKRNELIKETTLMEEEAKKRADSFRREVRNRNKELIEQNADLEKSLKDKQEKLDFIDLSADLRTVQKELNDDVRALEQQKSALSEQIDQLGGELTQVARHASHFAFDGAIASKLLEAAAAYAGESQKASCAARAEAVDHLPLSGYSKAQLADYLVRSVQLFREYDRNAVLNLFICLTQSFLTVLSGGPGSGKTSICNIMGRVLGLTSVKNLVAEGLWEDTSDADRYLPISVERGWTSKRDFVGYFNPLTKSFESVDDRRFEAFRELDEEARRGIEKLPFVMMLDEANLSPMEYYWADFMNICDQRTDLSFISLGDKKHYRIPDTLRFLATINNDHTTEILSPRLIDRATVITLPDIDWGALSHRKQVTNFDAKLISWKALQELFGPQEIKAHEEDMSEILDELYDRFARAGFPVSARARLSIERYVSAASAVFTDDRQPAYIIALDYALAQKLLPKLTGTGEDFELWLESLKTYCESNGLDISLKQIDDMVRRGRANMGYFKFF